MFHGGWEVWVHGVSAIICISELIIVRSMVSYIMCVVEILYVCVYIYIYIYTHTYIHTYPIHIQYAILYKNMDFVNFDVLLTVHLSIFISVINQPDAQNFCFTISLFHASTRFKHMCLSSGGQNCITQPLVSSHL
jgi:hypothetical protein